MADRWWTLVAVCAATFMLLLDVTIVVVALPEIQQGLHASLGDVQWVVDAYALTLAAVLLTSGSLADLYGRRLLFVVGLVLFTGGSLLCGLAQSPLMLILCRAGQGIGGSMLFSTSLALLAQDFRGRERGVAFGAWGAITGVAVGLGPVLGGVITSGISWRGIFLVNVPIGIAVIALTRWRVHESRTPHARRPDWIGFGVLTVGLVSLVYGLIRASEQTWGDSLVISALALGGVLIGAFLVVERYVPHPMFDLSLLRVPTFNGGLATAFAMNASLFAMFVYMVLYLQDALGYSALGTGLRLLLVTGATLVLAPIAGRLSSQMPVRWLIGPGLVLVGAGLVLMSGLDATSSWTHLAVGFVLAGIGSGMVNPPLASTAVGVVEPRQSGMASGVNTTLRQIGIAVGIATYGSIFSSSLHHSFGRALSNPTFAAHAAQIGTLVSGGQVDQALRLVPPASRAHLAAVIRGSFAGALNDLLIVSGIVAFAGAAAGFFLIRSKDFVAAHRYEAAAVPDVASELDRHVRSVVGDGVEPVADGPVSSSSGLTAQPPRRPSPPG